MTKGRFEARLVRPQGVGTWTFALVPKATTERMGLRARMRVKGTVDGAAFRCALNPRGGGQYFIVVNKELRDRIGREPGDSVRVVIEVDTSPVVIEVPPDLERALKGSPNARGFFERIAPSHKKAYVQWVTGAKRAETRERRVQKALRMLAAKKTLN